MRDDIMLVRRVDPQRPPSSRSCSSLLATEPPHFRAATLYAPVLYANSGTETARRGNVIGRHARNASANATAVWRAGGWFRSGDRAVMDKTGWERLIERIKELINRGSGEDQSRGDAGGSWGRGQGARGRGVWCSG